MPSNKIFIAPCDECGAPVESWPGEEKRLKTLGELRHCDKCLDPEFLHDDGCFYMYGRVADPKRCTCEEDMPKYGCPGLLHHEDPLELFTHLEDVIRMCADRCSEARETAATTEGATSESAAALAEAWNVAIDMAHQAYRLAVQMTDHDRLVQHTPRGPNPYAVAMFAGRR